MESQHKIEHIIIENTSEPINQEPITIEKTPAVLEKLEEWKQKVSPSNFHSYLHNPINFYLEKILNAKESTEIEEEISRRNYGTLVHSALEYLYKKVIGKILNINDLENLLQQVDESINFAISELKHQPEFYDIGMNYIHKQIAKRIVEDVIKYDLELIKNNNSLEIISLEKNFENVNLKIDENNEVFFNGKIDRIDKLNDTIRIIDYKTKKLDPNKDKLIIEFKEIKSKNISVEEIKNDKLPYLFNNESYKYALQLVIYKYCISKLNEFSNNIYCGIWFLEEANKGIKYLEAINVTDEELMTPIKNLILEILNPEIPFTEKVHESWN